MSDAHDVSPAQQLTMLRAAAKDHELRISALESQLNAAERIAALLAENRIADQQAAANAAWGAHDNQGKKEPTP